MPARDSESDLVRNLLVRYATVTPGGLVLDPEAGPLPETAATLVRSSPARTLYRSRKPVCRSLDGVHAFNRKECASCPDRGACTPQLRVEIDVGDEPYRLILSFTSAKNFLLFVDQVLKQGRQTSNLPIRIRVVDRGRWGEVRFSIDNS